MLKKCADLMEVMYSPAPTEPEDDLSSFSRRSDDDLDAIFESDSSNATVAADDQGDAEVNSNTNLTNILEFQTIYNLIKISIII